MNGRFANRSQFFVRRNIGLVSRLIGSFEICLYLRESESDFLELPAGIEFGLIQMMF